MSYTDIPYTAVDAAILERITEEEIAHWMAAKLQQIRASGLLAKHLGFSMTEAAWHPRYKAEPFFYYAFDLMGTEKLSGSSASIGEAIRTLRAEIEGDVPAERARKLRVEAQKALERAEAIEREHAAATATENSAKGGL